MTLRYLTAGESHGPGLVAIAEGFPAGLRIDFEAVNGDLRRRQKGYGRGGRQKIETDAAQFLAGLRGAVTTGAPIAFVIWNKDHENWKELVSPYARGGKKFTQVRPGHADLAGALKYGFDDARDVLERASARSTAATVALGALARALLSGLHVEVASRVVAIGPRSQAFDGPPGPQQRAAIEASDLHVDDEALAAEWRALIDAEKARGGSIGGAFEVYGTGLPIGLGSHVHPDRRLDARLAAALCGIQAIRGFEVGDGLQTYRPGYEFHDAIHHDPERGFWRETNRAGGLEGGMTNGMPLRVRGYMKPIPTMLHPLATVDLATRQATQARYERSDVCAVPAAAVVGEAVVCWELASAVLEKFGGDTAEDVEKALEAYAARIGDILSLTGMMGSGKSATARELSRLTGREVVSLDREIVRRAGKAVAAIFAEEGEQRFRALEREAVAALAPGVIADLGGGAFCDPVNAERLLSAGRVIFLEVSAEEAARRIGTDGSRPLAGRWDELLQARLPLYRRAHVTVVTDGLTPELVARRIILALEALSTEAT